MVRVSDFRIVFSLALLSGTVGVPLHASSPSGLAPTISAVDSRPDSNGAVVFEPNRGQADAGARFIARGYGYVLYVTDRGTLLSVDPQSSSSGIGPATLSIDLVDGTGKSQIEAVDQLAGTSSYIQGSDRTKWITGLPNFGLVQIHNAYPGVHINVRGAREQVEYEFLVDARASLSAFSLAIGGADTLRLKSSGDLLIHNKQFALWLKKPLAYQHIKGEKRPVQAGYSLKGRKVSFVVGPHDPSQPLVIHPVLEVGEQPD